MPANGRRDLIRRLKVKLLQNMGHNGPVLRLRCSGTGRARNHILFYSLYIYIYIYIYIYMCVCVCVCVCVSLSMTIPCLRNFRIFLSVCGTQTIYKV